jgi:hypothetical protein
MMQDVQVKLNAKLPQRKWHTTRRLFTSKQTYINLRNKLVKFYMSSRALYGAETGTLWKADQKYLQSLKCGDGEGWRSVGPIT